MTNFPPPPPPGICFSKRGHSSSSAPPDGSAVAPSVDRQGMLHGHSAVATTSHVVAGGPSTSTTETTTSTFVQQQMSGLSLNGVDDAAYRQRQQQQQTVRPPPPPPSLQHHPLPMQHQHYPPPPTFQNGRQYPHNLQQRTMPPVSSMQQSMMMQRHQHPLPGGAVRQTNVPPFKTNMSMPVPHSHYVQSQSTMSQTANVPPTPRYPQQQQHHVSRNTTTTMIQPPPPPPTTTQSRPLIPPQPTTSRQQHPPHRTPPPLEEKDKIDPSQIPRIPLFTRPHHAPAAIYPVVSTPGTTTFNAFATSTAAAAFSQHQPAPQPPPADSRYVCDTSSSVHVNPRIMRSTVYTFPRDDSTRRKVGIPLGMIVNPLAGLTRDECGSFDTTAADVDGVERIPLVPNQTKYSTSSTSSSTTSSSILPPRCTRCHAYFNPYCIASSSNTFSTTFQGGYHSYAPNQIYHCNFCSTQNSITIPDAYITRGWDNIAYQHGTVEYEVDGPYIVRKSTENVRLYGVEYVPEFTNGEKRTRRQGGGDSFFHHRSRDDGITSFGWKETLYAMKEVATSLRESAFADGSSGGAAGIVPVKIGVFAYCRDMLVFPYIRRSKSTSENEGIEVDADEEPVMEIGVCIVSDVEEDPFCPLPLKEWTYDISTNDMDWIRFCRVMDSFTEIMEMLTVGIERKEEVWVKNCGGAAMAALVDALKDSGGRATLITTRRPNYGVGALRDREATKQSQQSRYLQVQSEKRLFTPLQHLTFTATALKAEEEIDRQASLFYKQLGQDAAKSRVSLDIIVTSSLLKPASMGQQPGPGVNGPNVREFLDVATLSELCRITCGRFKWLRVGNECGIAIDDDGQSISFTGEQLREELKRSALAYMGSDAVFKLRCSNGIQVKSYSPTLPSGTLVGDGIVDSAELELSSIDSSTAVAVLLEHKIGGITNTMDPGKKNAPMVFFQSAVLYTTLAGKRRVRVSTLGLPTTKVAADVFRSADLGTVAAIMTRQAVSDVNTSDDGLKSARFNVFDQCVSILANYRLHTNARTSPSGQLILPDSLQLLPLFCLSLRKSRMFRHSLQSNSPSAKASPTADERAYHIFYASMISPNIALQCIHPNVFQVSDMRSRDGDMITPPVLQANRSIDEAVIEATMKPVCQMPKSTNPSMTCLDESGMYMLDDRFAFYLFVGKDVPEERWRDLISVKSENGGHNGSYNGVPVGSLALASTDAGNKVRSILHQLRVMNAPNPTLALNVRPTYAPLILVFVGRGSVFEGEMDSLLIDDPDSHEKSYVDFLCTMHRAIREKNANAE